ncbi:hypothetical protein [Herbaspirillum sp. SJZ099]|uniref:hypothetical protein n=1 Tax=Herbaspirillum sp. SJZ099 TaxID=2572916 RepID=UPI00119EC564|nr:hypothetical protein [Herbaspirillum sp. SJZ099]
MKTTVSILLLCAASISLNAKAQALPASCEQWISAVEVCTQNSISYMEKADPARVKTAKEVLSNMSDLRNTAKEQMSKTGFEDVAERCTKPAFIKSMNNTVSGIATYLSFNHALGKDCKRKVQEIQVQQ